MKRIYLEKSDIEKLVAQAKKDCKKFIGFEVNYKSSCVHFEWYGYHSDGEDNFRHHDWLIVFDEQESYSWLFDCVTDFHISVSGSSPVWPDAKTYCEWN